MSLQARNITAALLAGWFYMATMPDNMFPGAKIKMLMGPYPTKAECEQRQLISMAIFDAIGTTADWTECKSTERKRSN